MKHSGKIMRQGYEGMAKSKTTKVELLCGKKDDKLR